MKNALLIVKSVMLMVLVQNVNFPFIYTITNVLKSAPLKHTKTKLILFAVTVQTIVMFVMM